MIRYVLYIVSYVDELLRPPAQWWWKKAASSGMWLNQIIISLVFFVGLLLQRHFTSSERVCPPSSVTRNASGALQQEVRGSCCCSISGTLRAFFLWYTLYTHTCCCFDLGGPSLMQKRPHTASTRLVVSQPGFECFEGDQPETICFGFTKKNCH